MDYIIRIREIAGIDINLLSDNSYLVHIIIVQLSGSKIIKSDEYLHIKSLDQIFEKIPVQIPVALNISGRGILHKQVPGEYQGHIIQSLIPGANSNEYYYQRFTYSAKEDIAIVRKQPVDHLINLFTDKGYIVLNAGISLGFAAGILQMINTGRQPQIFTGNHIVHLSTEGEMTSYATSPSHAQIIECAIDAIILKSIQIPSFSIAVNTLIDIQEAPGIEVESIIQARYNYRHKKIFTTSAWAILLFLLGTLLINFMVYQHYYQLNEESLARRTLYQNRLDNLDTLQTKVKQKELFMQKLGWLKPASFSEISDKLAASVPEDITLTEMDIFPISGKENTDVQFNSKRDTVMITGYCYEPGSVNEWISSMDSIDMIQSVKLLNYWYKKEDETGNFRIEIKLK